MTSESKIMLTTVKPNLMCQFRIQNAGDNLPVKPFFYEKGLSNISVDNIFAVQMPRLEILSQDSPRWPDSCESLEQRKRGDWPSYEVIKQVREAGCHIVPKSFGAKYPKTWLKLLSRTGPGSGYENGSWGISFSVSERILAN